MSLFRSLAADPWRLAWQGFRAVLPERPGAFRIMLLHDVPAEWRPSFARLVSGLRERGRLIDPAEAERRLNGGAVAPGPVPWLISFDDGFVSNAEVARDILDPLGIRALFFLCPGLMELPAGRRPDAVAANVFRGRVPAEGVPELMDWRAAEGLLRAGHVLGSHTLSHARLAGLEPDRRAEEIGRAARLLGDRLGVSPDWFAYTFGDVDSIDAAALAEIGRVHRWCRSGVRGTNASGTPPLALRGDNVDLNGTPSWRRLVLSGGLDPLYRAARRRLDSLVRA